MFPKRFTLFRFLERHCLPQSRLVCENPIQLTRHTSLDQDGNHNIHRSFQRRFSCSFMSSSLSSKAVVILSPNFSVVPFVGSRYFTTDVSPSLARFRKTTRNTKKRKILLIRPGAPYFPMEADDWDILSMAKDPSLHFRHLSLLHDEERHRMDIAMCDKTILIRLLHVKAIIKKDACILYDYDNRIVENSVAPSLISVVAERWDTTAKITKHARTDTELAQQTVTAKEGVLVDSYYPENVKNVNISEKIISTDSWNDSFEATVLNVLLSGVAHRMETKLCQISPIIYAVLREIENDTTGEGLRKLIPLKKFVTEHESFSKLINQVLSRITLDEQRLSEINLSNFPVSQIKYIENLIEFHRRDIEDIGRQFSYLSEQIDDTREVINIGLDNQRNRMILFNLKISVISIAFAACTVPASLLGMNLYHGFEESHLAFYAVTGAIMLIGLWGYWRTTSYVRNRITKDAFQTHTEILALRNVVASLDEIEYILKHNANSSEIDADSFRKLLLEATGKHISDHEMNLISHAFDDDQDDFFQYQTYKNIIQGFKR